MTVLHKAAKRRQKFKVPAKNFQLEFPEPFFFIVKTPGRKFSDRELSEIDALNEDLRIENNAAGDFEIMPPHFPETSRKNIAIDAKLWIWAEKDQTGVYFELSAKFTLPNGAKRMPDAAWILKERYFALPSKEREESFAAIAPDFVTELRSKSDRLRNLQKNEGIHRKRRSSWLAD